MNNHDFLQLQLEKEELLWDLNMVGYSEETFNQLKEIEITIQRIQSTNARTRKLDFIKNLN